MSETGFSINFIDSLQQYKNQNKIDLMNIVLHGRNLSTEFLNSTNITPEAGFDYSYYHKVNTAGGIHELIKIYDPIDLMYKRVIWNRYNFTNYFDQARNKKLLTRKHNDLNLDSDFFISIDDGVANEILFGSKSKYGHLIDADSYVSYNFKSSYTKKYEINNDRITVNVDHITENQQQRRALGNDIGFLVINNPGNYVSSLGVRGVRIYLTRRNEVGSKIPVIQ